MHTSKFGVEQINAQAGTNSHKLFISILIIYLTYPVPDHGLILPVQLQDKQCSPYICQIPYSQRSDNNGYP